MNTLIPSGPASTTRRVNAGIALNIYTVEAFAALCRVEFERSAMLQIDLSAVEACDTLGVQVLLSARRTAEVQSKSLEFVHVTPAVRRAAAAVECESLFNPIASQP